MEEVRLELYQEEQMERERQQMVAEIQRRLEQRLELQRVEAEQKRLKALKRAAEAEEEEMFRQQVGKSLVDIPKGYNESKYIL